MQILAPSVCQICKRLRVHDLERHRENVHAHKIDNNYYIVSYLNLCTANRDKGYITPLFCPY